MYDVGGKLLTLDLKNLPGAVSDGQTNDRPDLVITVNEEDFLNLASGKANPQQLFMKGRLKIKGNMAIALKVQTVMEAARKEMGNISSSVATGSTAITPTPSVTNKLKSGPIFDAIRIAINNDGATLVKKVSGIIQITLTEGTPTGKVLACVVLNLKTGKGTINEYSNATTVPKDVKADVILTAADGDFHDLGTGTLNSQTAFMKGKLKISGNLSLAMKLSTVLEATRRGPNAKL